jgi:S-adenosylmethionine-dependent methyltransferase
MVEWKDWQQAPWGRLRYQMAYANLHRHLPQRSLKILDVGGGNGVESLALAQSGHHITLVDYSSEMLAEAQRTAQELRVAQQVRIVQGDMTVELSSLFPAATFDVVLLHSVLQFVDDAGPTIQMAGTLVRPGGLLSIISLNPAADAYRAAFQQLDLAAAYAQLDGTTVYGTMFETDLRRYTVDELRQWMHSADCTALAEYGIRCICDYLPDPDNTRKADPAFFADLERLEAAMSDKYPYYLLARFIHLIGQRATETEQASTPE